MIRPGLFIEKTERGIARALPDITQHLIVGAVFLDDIHHVLERRGDALGHILEHQVVVGRIGDHLAGVVPQRVLIERRNERGRSLFDRCNVLVRSLTFVADCVAFGRIGALGIGVAARTFAVEDTRRPSASTRAAVGYHPVGTIPSTWLRASVTSTTAAAFASEKITYSRFLSRLNANAQG